MSHLEDTLEYPVRGHWLERTLYGSALVVGSVVLVPLVVLAGYSVRVLETSLEGATEPPAFEEWGSLFRRGVGALAITIAYVLGPLLAGALLGVVLGAVGYYGLVGLAPVIGGDSDLVWLVSGGAGLLAGFVGLVVAGVTLVSWLCLPAGLIRYAQTDRLRSAVDRSAITSLVRTREYLGAIVVLQLVPLVAPLLALVAAVTIVGILAVPAIGFLTVLVSVRILGLFVADSGGDRSGFAPSAHLEQTSPE